MMVFSPILPNALKGTYDNFRLDSLKAMEKSAKKAQKMLEGTTNNWKHKVKFKYRISSAGNSFSATVNTDDEIWNWVDRGTGPHIIEAIVKDPTGKTKEEREIALRSMMRGKVRVPRLFFLTKKMPKTVPFSLSSGKGSKGTLPEHFPSRVSHPGIRPRMFTDHVQMLWEPIFEADIEDVIVRWAIKTGHAA